MSTTTKDGYTLDDSVGTRVCRYCHGRLRAYRKPGIPITSWRTRYMSVYCTSRTEPAGAGQMRLLPHEPGIPAMDDLLLLERWLNS